MSTQTTVSSTKDVIISFGTANMKINGYTLDDTLSGNIVNHVHEISDINNLEDRLTSLESGDISNSQEAIIDLIYPVGSVYISMDQTNPSSKFGVGTWDQISITGSDTYYYWHRTA